MQHFVQNFFYFCFGMARHRNTYWHWALVTGATSGIGLAFARELARGGCNLAIVARNQQRLNIVAEQLRAEGAPKVVPIVCDLSKPDSAESLYKECQQLPSEIDLVVNNAGMFAYCDMAKMSPERIEQFVALHIVATTTLCRLFAASMAKRGSGAIINLSSFAANMAWPGLGMYSATKAYINNFSVALAREVRSQGVRVLSVTPAGVATDLYGLPSGLQRRALRWGVLMSAESVARKSLRALRRGKRRYTPGVTNRLMRPIVGVMPEGIISLLRRKTIAFQK